MSSMDNQLEVSPEQVEALIKESSDQPKLIDVREDWELTRGILPGAAHVPLSRFEELLPVFQPGVDYVIYCEHGIRSLDVAAWLHQNRSINAKSMRGGFAVWSGPVESLDKGST